MYIDDKGIVLRCVKYDDKSFVAHLFTESRGHVSFMVNSSRSKRAGVGARLFQPLTFLSLQWDLKPYASLQRIKEARLLFVLQSIPLDPIKRSVAMLVTEFMAYALREEATNPELYQYIEHSLRWFDTAEDKHANFHLVFLLKMARFLGIAPNMESYECGNTFDLTRGDFTPPGSADGATLTAYDSHLLFLLNGATYETMGTISMNRQDRARMIGHLSAYYNIHIPKFPTLQSLDILQQLL